MYAYFGLCTAFNVLVSLLVVGRLTLVRRRVAKIIGKGNIVYLVIIYRDNNPGPTFEHSSQFTNIAAIFIESYALIAASYLTVSISAAVTDLEDPVRLLFLSINAQMEVGMTATPNRRTLTCLHCLDDWLPSCFLSSPVWTCMDERDSVSAEQDTV